MNVNPSLYSTELGPPAISSEISTGLPAATPTRRRRRPALSCIQCRNRKLKCDRTLPSCARCLKSKSTVCAYDPDTLAKMRGSASSRKLATPHQSTSTFVSQASTLPFTAEISPIISSRRGFIPTVGYSIADSQAPVRQPSPGDIPLAAGNVDTYTLADDPALKKIAKRKGKDKKKMQFVGMSHWMHICKEFDQIRLFKHCKSSDASQEVYRTFKKCKDMARVLKVERFSNSLNASDWKSQVPAREISDELIQHYFRTFESTYRIVHRPSFLLEYDEYWRNPTAASDSFVIKLLLILANGAIFSVTTFNGRSTRVVAADWINTAQNWLIGPSAKSRLSTTGIEVQCLLVLAQQTHSTRSDLFWIDTGSLVRNAMSAGLHRDPTLSPKLSFFSAEIRRRLWATVIELATQASLDCGMPPLFSFDDFDCEPPANYDDADIDETTNDYHPKKDDSLFTETSIQRTLGRSLQTRLEICKLLNGIRSNPSYEKVLTLSTELTSHIRSHSKLYQASQHSDSRFTILQKNMLDLLSRRFLLALHCPFAIQASTDPRLYFSRKSALEAALIMLSYPTSGEPADDFERMKIFSSSSFQEISRRACSTVCLELITLMKEDSSPIVVSGTSPGSAARQPLHGAVEIGVALAKKRVQDGEMNVKGWLFLSMVQAQTTAMENGGDVADAIMSRAKEVAEDAYDILRKRVTHTPASSSTPDPAGDSVSEGLGENFDWDVLMQETISEFDIANTWLFNSWDDANIPP